MTLLATQLVDTYCVDSLRTGRLARGVAVIGQRLYHRYVTPQGMLPGGPDEEDFGFDLLELLGENADASTLAALPARIENEALKDSQIHAATVSIVTTRDGASITYEITIAAESDAGPFELALRVGDVTVSLLGIS